MTRIAAAALEALRLTSYAGLVVMFAVFGDRHVMGRDREWLRWPSGWRAEGT